MTSGRIETDLLPGPDGVPFADYFAGSLAALRELEIDHLVAIDSSAIVLTPLGRLFARNVAACFDVRSPQDSRKHASAV